jgi:hypothetical protein
LSLVLLDSAARLGAQLIRSTDKIKFRRRQ